MLTYRRGSHATYQEALKRKREAGCSVEKQRAAKKRAAEQIKLLNDKKAKLLHCNDRKVKFEHIFAFIYADTEQASLFHLI